MPVFILHLGENALGPHNDVPHALAGDAIILRNFSLGRGLHCSRGRRTLLAVGEQIAIKIKEQRHPISLIFHPCPSIHQNFKKNVKQLSFTTRESYNILCLCQVLFFKAPFYHFVR
jgi:hypothetical protein